MKPSEIIALARRQTGCTLDIVTEDEAYKFLNFIIEDFGADIRASDSGHGFDYLTFDVEAGQAIYPMDNDPGEWYNNFPIGKLEKVWLRVKDGKWKDLPIRFVDKIDINDFPDQGDPEICFLTNNAINLVPMPKYATQMMIWGYDYNWEITPYPTITSGTQGNVLYDRYPDGDVPGALYPYAWRSQNSNVLWYTISQKPVVGDYTYGEPNDDTDKNAIVAVEYHDKENSIFIPKRWHYILVEGLKYWMYGNMGVNFETARSNSRNFYDSEKMKALQNIMDRGQESDEPYYPDLNFLNY